MLNRTTRFIGWSTPAFMLLLLIGAGVGCSSQATGNEKGGTESSDPDDTTSSTADEASKDAKNGKDEKGREDKKEKEVPVPVEVASLERGTIESFLRSSTNLEAEEEVKVYSQAARLVTDLFVEEGDRVDGGAILLRLQDDEQRSAFAKAQNEYDKAAREYARQKQLFEKELISEEVFNNATYQVEQLRISLEDAKRELGYTEVRAPIAGTITGRHVKVGDQITVGQHLFDLVDFDSIVARIYVPEKELPRLDVGQRAEIQAQGAGRGPRVGRVERISPIVDPRTGTVKVTVALDGRHDMRPGMYVDVKLITDRHDGVVLVPKRALVYDQDQIFVYRLGGERRVERLRLDAVLEDKDSVEPESGFAAGDQIVVAGQAGLKHQALVRLPGDPDPEEKGSEKDDEAAGDAAVAEGR